MTVPERLIRNLSACETSVTTAPLAVRSPSPPTRRWSVRRCRSWSAAASGAPAGASGEVVIGWRAGASASCSGQWSRRSRRRPPPSGSGSWRTAGSPSPRRPRSPPCRVNLPRAGGLDTSRDRRAARRSGGCPRRSRTRNARRGASPGYCREEGFRRPARRRPRGRYCRGKRSPGLSLTGHWRRRTETGGGQQGIAPNNEVVGRLVHDYRLGIGVASPRITQVVRQVVLEEHARRGATRVVLVGAGHRHHIPHPMDHVVADGHVLDRGPRSGAALIPRRHDDGRAPEVIPELVALDQDPSGVLELEEVLEGPPRRVGGLPARIPGSIFAEGVATDLDVRGDEP